MNPQLGQEVMRWIMPNWTLEAGTACKTFLGHVEKYLSGLREKVVKEVEVHNLELPREDIFLCTASESHAFRPVYDLEKLKEAIIRKIVVSRLGNTKGAIEAHSKKV